MKHGTDLAYEAQDLIAPIRCGLRRQEWRRNSKAIRDVAEMGGDDHAMARAMNVSRKQMLIYASEVPQFAAELHTCLRMAKARTNGKTQSITWARRRVTKMQRWRERAEPLPLPRFMDEPLVSSEDPTPKTIGEFADFLEANGDEEFATYLRGEEQNTKEAPDPEPPSVPDGMLAEDWEAYAIDIIRIGHGGGDDYSMAAELRVSRSAMLQYASVIPAFNDTLEYARTLAQAWWSDRMREAVYKRSGLVGSIVCHGFEWMHKTDDHGIENTLRHQ